MPTPLNTTTLFNTPFAQLFQSLTPGISPASTFQKTIPASSFYQPTATPSRQSSVASPTPFSQLFSNLSGQALAPAVIPPAIVVPPIASPPTPAPPPPTPAPIVLTPVSPQPFSLSLEQLSPFARLFQSLTGRPLPTPSQAPSPGMTPFERLFASLVGPTPIPVPVLTPISVPVPTPISVPVPIPVSTSVPTPLPAPIPDPILTPISDPIPAVPVIPIVGTGNGLLAEYYNNANRTEAVVSRIENSVDFNWKAGSPDSRINAGNFSARWSGEVQARFNEEYTFFATADESIKLTIDGKTIVDLLTTQTTQERSGKITLEAGKRYTIQLDYQENLGDALASLAWSSIDQAKQIIPKDYLYSRSTLVAPLPTMVLRTPAVTVREDAGFARMQIDRVGNFNLVSGINYTTNNGSAQLGVDYLSTIGTATFGIGQSTVFVDIPIVNGLIPKSNKTFGFNLGATDNAIGGVARTSTITILNNLAPPTIEFSSNNFAVPEDGGKVTITVNRNGNTNGVSSIDYATANGTALAGTNYVTQTGTVNFAAGETSKTFTIGIINDPLVTPSETFTIALSNEIGSTLDAKILTTVTISDVSGLPVSQAYIKGLNQPISFKWIPGSQTMFIAEKDGIVKVANGTTLQATPFLDFRDQINSARDRGLMDITLHPDFGKGKGKDYLYLLYVYDPAEAPVRDVANNRNARLTRVRAQNINGIWSAVAGSEEILVGKNSTWNNISNPNEDGTNRLDLPASGVTINLDGSRTNLQDYIAVDSQSHAPGTVVFGADGKLYVTIGDGCSYSDTDPRAIRVQDVGNLSGKVLRIDPDTGEGLADNPFWNGNQNSNASKVFALGVRNGFRSVFGPTGQLLVADVGWNTWEEINIVTKGANLGWPYFEGGTGTPLQTGGYQDIQPAKDFYASGKLTQGPAYAYTHDGFSSAIMVGDFYLGDNPVWKNTVFISDISRGTVDALTFDANGIYQADKKRTVVAPGATAMPYIVDMNMGADGNMYYASILTGQIGRWLLG